MKVSILIPVYNSEKYLELAIQSVLSQTYQNIEIIIVDDGSLDNSLAIARSYESENIKIFTQKNGGACKARNKAFAESSGDYIQYLDADDVLSGSKIKNQMAMVSTLNKDVVFSCRWARFYDEDEADNIVAPRRLLDKDWDDPVDWLTLSWLGEGMGVNSMWLTPRRLIEKAGPWDERLSINQDGEFFCRVLLKSEGIAYCDDGMVYYRSGNLASVSQTRYGRKVSDLLLSYKLYEENILKREDSVRVRRALACNYLTFIYSYYDSNPEISRTAREYLNALGVQNLPGAGGKNFRLLAKAMGFDNALIARSLFRKILLKKNLQNQ